VVIAQNAHNCKYSRMHNAGDERVDIEVGAQYLFLTKLPDNVSKKQSLVAIG